MQEKVVVISESELEELIERAVRKALSNGAGNGNGAGEDRRLTPEQAAEKLNVNVRWLYRHARKLPFTERLSRKCLRFSENGLLRYLASRKARQ